MKRFEIHLDNDFGTHQYTQKIKKIKNTQKNKQDFLPNEPKEVHKKLGNQHDKFSLVWSSGPLVSYL